MTRSEAERLAAAHGWRLLDPDVDAKVAVFERDDGKAWLAAPRPLDSEQIRDALAANPAI